MNILNGIIHLQLVYFNERIFIEDVRDPPNESSEKKKKKERQ